MATFPALEPAGRTFVQGEIPFSATVAFTGAQIRWREANVPVGQRLSLQFVHLTRAELDLLLAHYRGQDGPTFPFALSAEVLAGYGAETLVPAGLAWRYSNIPQVETRGTRHNVTVELVAAA